MKLQFQETCKLNGKREIRRVANAGPFGPGLLRRYVIREDTSNESSRSVGVENAM